MKKSPIGPEKGKQSDFLMMEEVIELQAKLRQEQLLVSSERQNFQRLNVELRQNSNVVNELSWICAQHRQNLNNLIISKPEIGPRYCCHRANILENTRFVDAYKANGVKYSQVLAYTNLFTYLYNNPYQLAQVLAIGDQIAAISNDQIASVVRTVATGLYGNAINSNDIQLVLRLLKELIQIQIVTSENPRRMLRAGSCSFARFYHSLHESLFSAKMFLTAALHDPVMRVLIEDEIPLEIDPVKAIQNWPARERLRRFGEEGSAEYEQKLKQYVQETINQLYKLTTKFIKSLCHRWCLFPATLRWLVQTMCFQLKRADFTEQCIYEMLTDMIFTNFICPAIVSPDLYGITDCPISETAQKNLITMGQILQMLALVKYQGKVDKKYADLFEKFEQNEIAELLLQLLPDFDLRMDSLIMANGNVEAEVVRSNVLVTQGDLNTFIDFLRNILSIDGLMVSGECRRKLGDILEQLPDKLQNLLNGNEERESSPEKKQSLISLGKQTKQKLNKTISLNANSNDDEASNDPESPEVVLSIPISIEQRSFELLSEEEVIRTTENEINNNLIKKEDDLQILSETNVGKLERQNEEGNSEMIHVDKKKHFSLMNDDVSIGNTSDNLEAVSEAPSNHSVASSLELEENDQNDNLSDMVSANVSGRGSPNISGRDTPSSQITEGNEPRQPAIPAAKILNKTRSEIQDKFCKFELKKPLEGGDETVSIMSDTWSTDVLASDSETLDASSERERNFSTPLIPSSVILPGDNNFDPLSNTTNASNFRANCDISETQSESAWSTDVLLASDSEKMTEVDTDDNQSIAAKSDVTDAGQDSVAFRDGNNNNNRPQQGSFNNPDSPFFAPRNKNNNPESPIYQSRNPDSLFFGQRNNYNEANNELEEGLNRFSGLRQSRELSRNSSYQSDIGSNAFLNPNRNSFDRSNSTGTTNAKKFHPARQNSSESNQSSTFDGEMKSDSFDSWKGDVKGAKRRTQNEHLNIFNSGNVNSQANSSSKARKNGKLPSGKGHFENDNQSHSNRGKHHVNHSSVKHNGSIAHCTGNSGTSSKREKIIKTNSNLSNPFAENVVSLEKKISFDDNNVILNEEIVEQRRTTMEQRNATFDGRRNGMMQMSTVSNKTSIKNGQKSVVNYENHEIIMRNNNKIVQSTCASSTSSVIYRDKDVKLIDLTNGTSSTTAEEQLIQKTQSLNLISNTAPEHKNVNGNCLPNGTITKHGKFTGAIPKSISFDATADKRTHNHHGHFHHHHNNHHNGHQEHHNNRSQSGNSGFLSKIKQGLKSRRSNRARNPQDFFDGTAQTNGNGPASGNLIDVGGDEQNDNVPFVETGDDILAKYRRKVSTSSEATASDSTSGSRNSSSIKSKNSTDSDFRSHNGDLNNLVNDDQFLFNNAKKKLRIVFSSSDLHTGDFRHNIGTKYGSPLIVYLQIQLAQALNLQNMHQISYVQEAIRCLMMMPAEQHQKLIHEMQSDLIMRQSYLKYLMRFRQGLLSALKNVERFEERLKRDLEMCQRHLIACCVRMFLEKRQNLVEDLQRQFAELTVGDEKIDLLEEFIGKLILELEKSGMSSSQLVNARISIERILLQKLYRQVMFPNDDADILRDQMLKDHIRRLGKTVTPDHATLCIPQEYLVEAPWSYAQQQILQISAYKTALEKVRCVVRCIATIMDMLTMASAGRVPSADDLIPVLIFVLIKANPPYLQSTIQYVDCFMADRLSGEDHYGWIQFCAAVQFIKMMDN